jgi:galactose mutarotase-like enzyme
MEKSVIKTISNEYLTVSAKSFGAELFSVKSAAGFEYMWQSDPSVWGKSSPVLFPVVGRMRNDGRYKIGDVEFVMPKHGFARDSEFALVDDGPDFMLFELVDSEATLACWPFRFVFRVRYTLERDSLRVGFEVVNADDRTMYFSLGAHPGFACPLEDGNSFSDYHLEFEVAERADRWYLVDGLLGHCKELFLDGTERIELSKELFAEDALIFKGLESSMITLASDRSERFVKVSFEGWPDMGIWSTGKGFVCIEPWFGHDDPIDFGGSFEEKPGIVSLGAGGEFLRDYEICFG